MERVTSIIDERAVDPHAAEAALARFDLRAREGLIGAFCAFVAGGALAISGNFMLILPCAAGAVAGILVSLSARGDRTALLVRLVGQRSAHSIPAVAQYASRINTMEWRCTLARRLTRAVLVGTGFEPRSETLPVMPERAEAHADAMLAIAYLLARDGVKVHPAALALLDRLVTNTARSPLLSPAVPEQHMRIALQRARSWIE